MHHPTPRLTARATLSPRINQLTQQYTAFGSFAGLLDALGGYIPSLHTASAHGSDTRRDLTELADAYDAAQVVRDDPRRAFRS